MVDKRRHRGDDGTYRLHAAKYGCPEPVEVPTARGGTKRERPEHARTCKAPWAYAIDKGIVGGKRQRVVLSAKSRAALDVKVKAYREQDAFGVSPTAQTVGQWLDYWILRVAPAEGVRPNTLTGYRSKIRLYLKPSVGHVKLQDLSAEHVERMHDWMRTLDKARVPGSHGVGPLSDTTIRQTHMVFRSALAAAVQRRKITYNPAEVVKAPKAADNPHKHIEIDEAKAVLKSATSERELCRLVVALALGLRQGEALGLRWTDYRSDDDGNYLLVEEAVYRIDGKLTRADVKSKASKRRVPVPDRMVPIFEAWRAIATDPYIFPGAAGGPCDSKADWKAWRESLARADVAPIPLHGARGSAASLLADMGVPDWRIAEILGHSQVRVTQRHYIKGTDARQREAIGGLIGELLP